jgi:hypothetical protein
MHLIRHHFDTACRFGMRRNGSLRRGGNEEGQGLLGKEGLRLRGLIHQKDRDTIPDGVDFAAAGALQGGAIVADGQRLAARRADQDLEKIGGDHGGNCTSSWFPPHAVE